MVAMRSGAFLASSDELNITVRGAGGHASEPHRTIDPIPAACEIVQALQTLVARRLNVFDSGVVSVTQINAGSAYNVIPDEAVIKGLIRAVSEETRKRIKEEIERVAFGVGAAHQMQVDVHIGEGYPLLINDADYAEFSTDIAATFLGRENIIHLPNPLMASEDFSYVLNQIPGAMMGVGATPIGVDTATAPPPHSSKVFFDEDAMKIGTSLLVGNALRHLNVTLS